MANISHRDFETVKLEAVRSSWINVSSKLDVLVVLTPTRKIYPNGLEIKMAYPQYPQQQQQPQQVQLQHDVVSGEQYRYALTNFVSGLYEQILLAISIFS